MNTSRRIVKKRQSYFARITTKGGERSFPLGRDKGIAIATYDRILAILSQGGDPWAEETAEKVPETSTSVTVKEATDRWLTERVDVEMEARNARMIRSRVERYLFPCLGVRAIQSLRRPDCHAYLGYLRKTRPDLEPGSLRHYLRDLRELLSWAMEVEIIDSNPWPQRRIMPRSEKRPPDRLTDQEMAILVELPEHWGFTLRFLLSTGLRWGEACRARRRDIEDRHLLIRKSKSGKPRRVPLSQAILEEIVEQGGDWLMPRQRKAPGGRAERSSSSFNATIRRLAEKRVAELNLSKKEREALTGLATFHAHQTRHTFACRYLEAGGTLTMLQEILGHASMEQTQQYGRPDAKAIRSDADRVFDRWRETVSA